MNFDLFAYRRFISNKNVHSQDSLGLSDAKFKVEFRQVDELDGQGQKQTVAFISAPTGRAQESVNQPAKADPVDGVSGPRQTIPSPVFDPKLVEDFLAGDYCLHGGTGWWRYEFCYGKRAEQYHEEKDGTRTVILLGVYNAEKHLSWLEQNPNKRPKPGPGRKQISHMYSDGSFCDLTGINLIFLKMNDNLMLTSISRFIAKSGSQAQM